MPVYDYTALPLGTAMQGGITKTCPYCVKVGLAEQVNGKVVYTHYQSMRWNEKAEALMTWEMCPRVLGRQAHSSA